ncbi:hypothetical protein [Inquilinus ginsengisoli]|uniref:hypothetical protein n=1 Tax=Inquilinus ginsengisoli TaxID=363840 RepID=UPI003D253486
MGLAACEAAYKLKALAETSPEAAAEAGLTFELEPASEDTDGMEHSRFAWWWADRTFGLYLIVDGVHPPGENAEGYLSLYIDKDFVLSMNLYRAAADGYQQIHVDQVTALAPGDWPAQLWAFVESLSGSSYCGTG